MKIALIQAPLFGAGTPPLGVASLSAYMRRRGHEVTALDLNIELYKKLPEKYAGLWHPERIELFWTSPAAAAEFVKEHRAYLEEQADRILKSGAKLVGFSICYSSLYLSLYLARLLKRKNKELLIVFGGPGASRHAAGKAIMEDGSVDFAVQGEGEVTLAEIVENKKARAFCKGALIRKNGKVLDCGDRELIKDLDALPFPDFSDFDFSDYTNPYEVPLLSSRGCSNSCNFCYERPYWGRFRSRSGASIHKEILYHLKNYPAGKFFVFYDSLVNGDIKELENLADLLIKDDLKIYWGGQAVIRKEMTRGLFLKLKRSGCIGLAFGLETASVPLMLKTGKFLAKGADPEKILRDGYRAGVYCSVNLMFGLPGETEADFRKTLAFMKRNRKYFGIVFPTSSFCIYNPGTYGFAHPDKLGIELVDENRWKSKDGSNTYLTRLEKCERFLKLAHDFKIPCNYPSPTLLSRNELIGRYYLQAGEVKKGIPYVIQAIKKEGLDISDFERLESCCLEPRLQDLYKKFLREVEDWKKSPGSRKPNRAIEQFERERAKMEERLRKKEMKMIESGKGGLI